MPTSSPLDKNSSFLPPPVESVIKQTPFQHFQFHPTQAPSYTHFSSHISPLGSLLHFTTIVFHDLYENAPPANVGSTIPNLDTKHVYSKTVFFQCQHCPATIPNPPDRSYSFAPPTLKSVVKESLFQPFQFSTPASPLIYCTHFTSGPATTSNPPDWNWQFAPPPLKSAVKQSLFQHFRFSTPSGPLIYSCHLPSELSRLHFAFSGHVLS